MILLECESESYSVVSDSLWPHGLYSSGNSPGQNTGVGSLSLLQGIFSTQGSNPGLPHCRQILYQLSHKACPTILDWAAYPFFSRSSQPRNRTGVSCIAGGFFTELKDMSAWVVMELQLVCCYCIFSPQKKWFSQRTVLWSRTEMPAQCSNPA